MPVTAAASRSLVALPLAVGVLGAMASVASGADWIPWVLAGFTTGHSLSGSI
jgi:hypothetical protein